MSRPLPFRTRLLLWYTAVIAAAMVCFAVVVWFGMRASLVTAQESLLANRLAAIEKFIPTELNDPPGDSTVLEEATEFGQTMPPDVRFRIYDSHGALLCEAGRFHEGFGILRQTGSFFGNGQNWRVEMEASLEPVSQMLARLTWIFVLSIPVALLAAAFGGWWMMRRAMAPVRAMTEAAASFDPSDLSRRVPVPEARDEFRQLAEMWNGMLDRIEEGFRRIRRFTADASHELRTPLAAMRVTAEVALRRTRPAEDYRAALEKIVAQTGRATALVEDMLALARADEQHIAPVREAVATGVLIREVAQAFSMLAEERGLRLATTLPEEELWINADPEALMRALSVLVDNAIKNTDAGSVEMRLRAAGQGVAIEVRDTGRGISAEDLPHVFERFYRGDKSRSSGGTGLGLAIGRAAVRAHGGEISVESQPGAFTVFTVVLPDGVIPEAPSYAESATGPSAR